MVKKISIAVVVFIMSVLFLVFIFSFIKQGEVVSETTSDEILEDSTFVILKEPLILNIYEEKLYSSFIEIKNGDLLSDNFFDVNDLKEDKIEILYSSLDGKIRKAYIDYQVVDVIVPIILGGDTKTIEKGYQGDINHLYISADNYDSNPTREIIGNYDVNQNGEYSLTLNVTDNSNNITSKDFTLKVVDKVSPYVSDKPKIYFDDLISNYKTEETKLGLDISKWQGEIDFNKLSKSEVDFVIIRLGYQYGYDGDNVIDPYFERNIKKLNELEIPVGIYFYSYATTTKEAKEQALFVIDELKDYDVSLPIAYDFESWSDFSALEMSLHDMNETARTFMETIELADEKAMNYSSKYYLENIWNIDEYPVWLANYTDKTEYAGDYIMWQLSNKGIIDGIDGYVDLNILYDKSIMEDTR